MPVSYPNQRMIHIHRERLNTDFLGIKNDNWMAAARDLSAHALKLYFYFAANADNYEFALSQAAVTRDIGMARSTFHDQFHVLVNKGYLVNTHGNTYDFYETPQPRTDVKEADRTATELIFEDDTPRGLISPQMIPNQPQDKTEINNKYSIYSNKYDFTF